MTRRDAAWLITRAASAVASKDLFGSWATAQSTPVLAHTAHSAPPPDPHNWANYSPKFFSAEEFGILDSFTAILIPSDGTPGAREAYVAAFTDFVIDAAAEYAPKTQRDWRKAMGWLSAQKFSAMTLEEQVALVEQMAAPERDSSKTHPGYAHYRLIKEMTIHAFYTSRAGMIGELDYKGLAYLTEFPACTHPEHRQV